MFKEQQLKKIKIKTKEQKYKETKTCPLTSNWSSLIKATTVNKLSVSNFNISQKSNGGFREATVKVPTRQANILESFLKHKSIPG